MDSRTLSQLKELAVKVTGKQRIAGDTVDEVLALMGANVAITANGLTLKDTNGVSYNVTVSITGELEAKKQYKITCIAKSGGIDITDVVIFTGRDTAAGKIIQPTTGKNIFVVPEGVYLFGAVYNNKGNNSVQTVNDTNIPMGEKTILFEF